MVICKLLQNKIKYTLFNYHITLKLKKKKKKRFTLELNGSNKNLLQYEELTLPTLKLKIFTKKRYFSI